MNRDFFHKSGYALLLLGLLGLWSCAEIDTPLPAREVSERPAMQFEDTTRLEMYNGNLLSWRMKTLYLERWSQNEHIFARPVLVDLYDSLGKRSAWLRADSASMDSKLNFINARGNVEARSPEGATVMADSLIWDKQSNLVRTESRVKVISEEGDVLLGTGFQSDASLKEWKILSGVKAIIQDVKNRGPSIID